MKIKILRIFPSGGKTIEEIEIEEYRWDNHKFSYIIKNDNHYRTLNIDEEIVGLE